jgi:hypothetical protein
MEPTRIAAMPAPDDDRALLRMLVLALLAGLIMWALVGWGLWTLLRHLAF